MDNDEIWREDMKFFENVHKHHDNLKDVVDKLRVDPCMDIPKVGDIVVVAAGPLNMGHAWIRLEAEVLYIANNSYKVRFASRYGKNKHADVWIDPVLVLDVIKND